MRSVGCAWKFPDLWKTLTGVLVGIYSVRATLQWFGCCFGVCKTLRASLELHGGDWDGLAPRRYQEELEGLVSKAGPEEAARSSFCLKKRGKKGPLCDKASAGGVCRPAAGKITKCSEAKLKF